MFKQNDVWFLCYFLKWNPLSSCHIQQKGKCCFISLKKAHGNYEGAAKIHS